MENAQLKFLEFSNLLACLRYEKVFLLFGLLTKHKFKLFELLLIFLLLISTSWALSWSMRIGLLYNSFFLSLHLIFFFFFVIFPSSILHSLIKPFLFLSILLLHFSTNLFIPPLLLLKNILNKLFAKIIPVWSILLCVIVY